MGEESNSETDVTEVEKVEEEKGEDRGPLKSKEVEAVYKKVVGIVGKKRVSKDEFETKLYSHDLASLPKMMELVFNDNFHEKNLPGPVFKVLVQLFSAHRKIFRIFIDNSPDF